MCKYISESEYKTDKELLSIKIILDEDIKVYNNEVVLYDNQIIPIYVFVLLMKMKYENKYGNIDKSNLTSLLSTISVDNKDITFPESFYKKIPYKTKFHTLF